MVVSSMPWLCSMRCALLMYLAITATLSRPCIGWSSSSRVFKRSRYSTRQFSTTMSSVIPRAAVSVVVRSSFDIPRYVLVQRGKEPNKGKWSLPGGKIEAGETTLAAAKRELHEETQLSPQEWHKVPFCCSDSIHCNREGEVEYHYVISQCFCSLTNEQKLVASDDAADAAWFSLDEMKSAINEGKHVMPTVIGVIERAERMYQSGLLQTSTSIDDDVS